MTNQTKKWIRGGLETLIHGGASALSGGSAASMIDPKDFSMFSSNQLKMAGACFLVNGGIRFMQWLAQNPLPPDDDATVTLNPLSPTVKPPEPKPIDPPKP